MTEPREPEAPRQRQPVSVLQLLLGVFFFWVSDVIAAYSLVHSPMIVSAVGLALFTVGIAFLAYRENKRGFAIGVVLGYVVLAVLSKGLCTFMPWVRS